MAYYYDSSSSSDGYDGHDMSNNGYGGNNSSDDRGSYSRSMPIARRGERSNTYDSRYSLAIPAAVRAQIPRSDRSRVPSNDDTTVQQYESFGVVPGTNGREVTYQRERFEETKTSERKYGTEREIHTSHHEYLYGEGNPDEGMQFERFTTSRTQSSRVPINRAIEYGSHNSGGRGSRGYKRGNRGGRRNYY